MRRLRRVALGSGFLTVLLGLVHISTGMTQFAWPTLAALWFHGSGMALMLIGALTTLAASERAWRTLGGVAVVANLLGLTLAVTFGDMTRWNAPQGPALIALFVAGALGCVPSLKHP